MYIAYKDMSKRGMVKDDITPYQRKRLAMACVSCSESVVDVTDPGIRRAKRGFARALGGISDNG